MGDFANIGLGSIDRSRSHWVKAKGFPGNMELELEATYAGGYRRVSRARRRRRRRPPRDHPGPPLQHHEGARDRAIIPGSPTTAWATS